MPALANQRSIGPCSAVIVLDEGDRGRVVADVEPAGDDAVAGGDAVGVEVDGDDGVGAGGDERPHERAADPAGGSGDDGDPAPGVHAGDPMPLPHLGGNRLWAGSVPETGTDPARIRIRRPDPCGVAFSTSW